MHPIPRPPLLPILLLALTLTGCAGTPTQPSAPARPLDARALTGTWYVVARIPNLLERGHMASRNEYTLREDGKLAVRYLYRTGPGSGYKALDALATPIAGSGGRQWRIRFFRLVPSTMRILEVAPDGAWALIDAPGRDMAWIFARKPDIDHQDYLDLRRRLRDHGVNVDKVWRVPQRPEQVGKRGFDYPKGD